MAETTKSMIADLIALQKALPVMPKDTANPFFKSKYTSLDTITELVFPIMTKHNFAWSTQPSYNAAGEPTLKYALLHSSGEKIEGEMKLLLKNQDAQGQGSAITYARRYALTGVLGIVSDADDDGEAARKAAQFAKATADTYSTSPEAPSRDITDEPISEESLETVRRAFAAAGYSGKQVTIFCNIHINKRAPTTEADANMIITALDVQEAA